MCPKRPRCACVGKQHSHRKSEKKRLVVVALDASLPYQAKNVYRFSCLFFASRKKVYRIAIAGEDRSKQKINNLSFFFRSGRPESAWKKYYINDSVGGAWKSVVIVGCRYDAFKFDIFIHLFNEILRDRQPLAIVVCAFSLYATRKRTRVA